jgi:hypothetical protein
MPGHASITLWWAVCMFSQLSPSPAPAEVYTSIFDDAAALLSARRRLSGDSNWDDRPPKKKREEQREEKRTERVALRLQNNTFVRCPSDAASHRLVSPDMEDRCCSRNCVEPYQITVMGLPSARHSLVKTLGTMAFSEKRMFIQARIQYKGNGSHTSIGPGERIKKFYLEPPAHLSDARTITIAPATRLVSVCVRAFKHITGVSNNAIYQPSVLSPFFGVDVAGGQAMRTDRTSPRTDDAIRWLNFMGAFFLQDPVDACIYVPFASKQIMYQLYSEDLNEYWRDKDDDDAVAGIQVADLELVIFLDREELKRQSFLKVWRQVSVF